MRYKQEKGAPQPLAMIYLFLLFIPCTVEHYVYMLRLGVKNRIKGLR